MGFNGVPRFSYGLKKVIITRALDIIRLRPVRSYTFEYQYLARSQDITQR